jgi:RNA polymerase sigma factor (sigma-70 family)
MSSTHAPTTQLVSRSVLAGALIGRQTAALPSTVLRRARREVATPRGSEGMVEPWSAPLAAGRPEVAWDLFIGRYRRLIFAAIRHYARDYDDVMDVFAHVCEALRADDLRRLRRFVEQPDHRAKFSTWLVTVVRHRTIDWFRHRDGRRRLSVVAQRMPPLRRRIFEYVFLEHHGHVEAYERIRSTEAPALSFRQFLAELRATYQAGLNSRRGNLLRQLGWPPALPPAREVLSPNSAAAAESQGLIEQALGSLNPADRAAVDLYVVEQLPAGDVARILGLRDAKAVYNRVHRALEVVRARLKHAGVQRDDLA